MVAGVSTAGGGVISRGGPDSVTMEADVRLGFKDGERGEALVVCDV